MEFAIYPFGNRYVLRTRYVCFANVGLTTEYTWCIIQIQKDYRIDGCPLNWLRNNRLVWRQGGYFFFVISITSAIIDTKSVPKRNSSSYVTIGTTPFIQEGEKCALLKEGQPHTVVIVLMGAIAPYIF